MMHLRNGDIKNGHDEVKFRSKKYIKMICKVCKEAGKEGSGKKRIGGCADLRMLRQDKGWDYR